MTSSKPRGRPRTFDRDAALAQAIRLFWRKGYESTSVRDLSDELGVGQPSLYSAFGDKRSFFTEAVVAYDQEHGIFIRAALGEEPLATDALRRILAEAPTRYTRRGLPRGCLLAGGDIGSDDEEVHAFLSRLRSQSTALISERIAADIDAGFLPEDTNANGLASYVTTVLNGLAQRARDNATRRELQDIATIAATALP